MTNYIITLDGLDSTGIYHATLWKDQIKLYIADGNTAMAALESVPVTRYVPDGMVSVLRLGDWVGCRFGDELLVMVDENDNKDG